MIYTPKVKLPSNFTKCYQEDNFFVVYDNKTKVMYSVSKNGVLSPLYFNTGNLQVFSNKWGDIMKNLSKQEKLQFIKDFSKIKVCNLCKDLRNW